MSQRAKPFMPDIQVLVLKNVGRETTNGKTPVSDRYKGAKKVIDLAPWLSDTSHIRTSKYIHQPAGAFSITVPDRPDKADLDTLYGLVEPMDCVEIRFSHEPHKTKQGGKLPIIMRGFITEVRRTESIQSGRPVRTVTIAGQDYGKIWQILQIHYFKNYTVGQTLLTQFKFFAQYGAAFNIMPAGDFVKAVVNEVVNDFLKQMGGRNKQQTNEAESGGGAEGEKKQEDATPVQLLKVTDEDIQVTEGVVSPFGVNQFDGGSVYSLLTQNCDVGPWNELFIEDREDGVHVVYRPNPYKNLDGEWLPKVKMPDPVELPAGDIQSISVTRSDANVANYYWVDSPRFEIVHGSIYRAVAAQGDPETFFVQQHKNCDPTLYGIRKMHEVTQQGDATAKHHGNGLKEADLKREMSLSVDWQTKRRVQLVEMNKDNVVFEAGSITCRGREEIKAGMYFNLTRGTVKSEGYIVGVDHDFVPFSHFSTTFQFQRGTGFAERAKRERGKEAPYYSEMVIKNG